MTNDEKKQKASAIVVEILELFQKHKLTVQDALRILRATQYAAGRPIYALESMTRIEIPNNDDVEWTHISVPVFPNLIE